jgi:citrate lyase beta subunit
VVYGGAHLFKASTIPKLGELARRAATEYDLAEAYGLDVEIAARVAEKLDREPVEDFRIDFEDGFGVRADDEEDETAVFAARELANATLPRQIGIRIKNGPRGLRTLKLFLENCASIPANFVVTLPKIANHWEVEALVGALRDYPAIGIELMVETPQAIFHLPELVTAAKGHCRAAHLGAYDYLASLGIAAQELHHPACDFARHMMQTQLAGTGVHLADGATNLLPLPVHRGENLTDEQKQENRATVRAAWKMHYDNVARSLYNGFYQGWDIHPAQIPPRFAAVFVFFAKGLPAAIARLKSFVAATAQASQVKGMFDDAATARGLVNYFRRAHACGLALDTDPLVRDLESLLKIDPGDH